MFSTIIPEEARKTMYNDNMKCFSLLAKRKNAKIISHDHGVNNFIKLLTNNSKVGHIYKGSSIYFFNDYCSSWDCGLLLDLYCYFI